MKKVTKKDVVAVGRELNRANRRLKQLIRAMENRDKDITSDQLQDFYDLQGQIAILLTSYEHRLEGY